MSNVEYKCPECGSRLFAAPGGTNLHCPRHSDTKYVQVEEYHGPNFEYVDPAQGKGSKATGIQTDPGLMNIKTVNKKVRVEESDENILRRLRNRYTTLYNERPDMRWGIPRLRGYVAEREKELEAKTKAEFEAKKGAQ